MQSHSILKICVFFPSTNIKKQPSLINFASTQWSLLRLNQTNFASAQWSLLRLNQTKVASTQLSILRMNLLDVLVHRTPIRKNSVAKNAGKLFAVVQRLAVGLQVRLPAEGLAAFRTRVNLLKERCTSYTH